MKGHMIRKMSEVIQKQRNQSLNIQKQSFKGVLMKRCSEISSRTHMPKRDFHVDAKQLYWNHTSTWVFACKFAAVNFHNCFSRSATEHSKEKEIDGR